jgi:hypothetical protein
MHERGVTVFCKGYRRLSTLSTLASPGRLGAAHTLLPGGRFMSTSRNYRLLALLAVSAIGCGFSPGQGMGTGNGNPGSAAGPGNGLLGAAGTTGTGITGTAATSGGGGNANNCGDVTTQSNKLPPDILLVQDKSGSMANNDNDTSCNNMPNCTSKWSELTSVLNTVTTSTDSGVNWGLKFFASPGNGGQCNVNAGADVPIAAMNSAAVNAAVAAQGPTSATPTRKAINAAVAYLQTLTDPNPKYILLATDGLPNCPDNCSGSACTNTPNTMEDTLVTQAITTANMAGFKTFVVGIGNVAAAVSALNDFANAGGEAQTGAATQYYAATDATALQNAFTAIVGAAGSCVFSVPTPPPTSSRTAIGVTADGNNVPKDLNNANGYNYTDANMTSIQIYGPTCDAIKAGTITNVTIVFHCVIN